MTNRIRGEAALLAGGRHYRLLLTLGALAEIEAGLGLDNLAGVAARLRSVRAEDLAIVVAALLRGGGHDLSPAEVLRLPCGLGALVAAVGDAFTAAGLGTGVPERSSSEAIALGAENGAPAPSSNEVVARGADTGVPERSSSEAVALGANDSRPFAGMPG